VSLHRHIRGTYRFDIFSDAFVELLAAQQTMAEGTDWYQGTADAVRKNLRYMTQPGIDYVVILSGDQLYRMDFADMLRTHLAAGADVTIAAKPVSARDASGLGIMKIDETGRVVGFVEKPQSEAELKDVRMDPAWIDARGINSQGRDCLASMGIYLFNSRVLAESLEHNNHQDFGREVFPHAIHDRKVQVHLFDGYWEDIGTIGSFYEANLQLAQPNPPFDFTAALSPIYSRPRFLPPSRVDGATVTGSLLADGCVIHPGAHIENSVIGLRCNIGRDVVIRNSVLMGSDYYESPDELAANQAAGIAPIGIGDGAVIDGAIVDKNCRIGPGAKVVNHADVREGSAGPHCAIQDGILVVEKGAYLPANWEA
jgi:glucose-1-phosphate adenylyltransferase